MKKTNIILALILTTIAASPASGMETGVYVQFSDGTSYRKCVEVDDGATAYDAVTAAGGFGIKDFGWGYGVCNIKGDGCPESNCFCGGWDFWNFWTNSNMAPTGIGDYEVRDGDVLGFTWGGWGSNKPENIRFNNICTKDAITDQKLDRKVEFDLDKVIQANQTYKIQVHREGQQDYPEPNTRIEIIPLEQMKDWGWRRVKDLGKVFSGKTDFQGNAEINMPATGAFMMIVHKPGVEQINYSINVMASLPTTTTTSTSPTKTTITIIQKPSGRTSWWLPGWYKY